MKEIKEGHGLTDISCEHGSRWIWWYPSKNRGKWEKVIWASRCHCTNPPKPFLKEVEENEVSKLQT